MSNPTTNTDSQTHEFVAIMLRPSCEQHGFMTLRTLAVQTKEQQFCGVWYDCARCHNSTLLPSKELLAFLETQKG